MKTKLSLLLIPLSALWMSTTYAGVDGHQVYTKGGSNPAAAPCIGCHGADGMGMPAAGFPRIAGLPAPYIVKQLHELKSGGSRDNPVMRTVVDAYTDEELQAVANAVSQMPVSLKVNDTSSELPNSAGEELATRGAWDRKIPPCTSCHGPSGVGVGTAFPALQGQGELYLSNQLKARQQGARKNDPNDLMGHIAKSLTDTEVASVSKYFSSLPQNGGRP
jgi:cytochrome c553